MQSGIKTTKLAHLSLSKIRSTPGLKVCRHALMLVALPQLITFLAMVNVTRYLLSMREVKNARPQERIQLTETIVAKQEPEVVMMSNQFLNTLMAAAPLKTAQVVH